MRAGLRSTLTSDIRGTSSGSRVPLGIGTWRRSVWLRAWPVTVARPRRLLTGFLAPPRRREPYTSRAHPGLRERLHAVVGGGRELEDRERGDGSARLAEAHLEIEDRVQLQVVQKRRMGG